MPYQTDDLLVEIRRDSHMAASQSSWTDAKLLALGDKMVLRRVVPAFIALAEGYYRETSDVALVTGQAAYDFPRYAMFNKIHLAHLVDSVGRLGVFLRKDPVDLQFWNATSTGTPVYLRLEGSQIVLNPTPNAGAIISWPTMRLWIYRRPGRMVLKAAAAQVLSVNTTTGQVTYTATPPATFTTATVHDFYSATSPFRRTASAITASALAGAVQTFPAASAALLTAGDWVCLRDETVFPPVPSIEATPFLQELIQESIAKSQASRDEQQAAMQAIVDDMMTVVTASGNRAEALPKVASLRHSPFVRGTRRRGLNSTRT